jgi:hypothetical protein
MLWKFLAMCAPKARSLSMSLLSLHDDASARIARATDTGTGFDRPPSTSQMPSATLE